ncbi:MAG TPA: hypothetical protein VMO47_16450 [Rhodothermales bacterium]|nr:hypothetical protein [Rhodothermales bacterium]
MKERNRAEAGFNLVEVLIAMGLLSTVLISIVTLFVMGRANVYSGKQMTRAVSIGTSVSEDLNSMRPSRIYSAFNVTSSTTKTTNTVAGVSYPNSIVRSTTDLSNDVDGLLDRWLALMPQSRLDDGVVTLVLQPRNQTNTSDPTTARILQVTVVVQWNEATRKRNVVMHTTRLDRSV